MNYDNFTNFIFEDKKCTNIHGILKCLNIRDFKKDTLNKLEFNKNNYDFWKNKDLTNMMMTMMKFNDYKNEPKRLAYPFVSLG
ncbi:hypothetical protein [Spiroplasma ixodetis]|uniref:Uncharacterized protein n=1 Tax=Spiroplasma ixodetis TaxID=2141 RepID=A0ABN7BWW1_9MOLU